VHFCAELVCRLAGQRCGDIAAISALLPKLLWRNPGPFIIRYAAAASPACSRLLGLGIADP
jgi:hypothetical protein